MKKLALMILLSLGLAGCQGQIEVSQLLGKWKVSGFNADTPNLSPAIIEDGRVEAMSSEYDLSSDGKSFLRSDYYIKGQTGNWIFDKDSKKLTITHSNEEEMGPTTYTVESVSETKMVWIQEIEGIGTLTLTLKKR